MSKVTDLMMDPPGGWKYGFPRAIPDDVIDTEQWLIDNGYPKSEIESLGDYFYCRFWDEEVDDTPVETTTTAKKTTRKAKSK